MASPTAAHVVTAALSLLGADTQQMAQPLVELLGQRGIVRAWQLRWLTDSELSALAVDAAGWSMGEMLALREAIDRSARVAGVGRQAGAVTLNPLNPAETEELAESGLAHLPPFMRSALTLPKTVGKADMNEFKPHKIGMAAWLGRLQAMPANEAKATLQSAGEQSTNISCVLLFVVWQMRSGTAADAHESSGYGDLPQILNFCVSLSTVLLIFAIMGYMAIASHVPLQPDVSVLQDDEFLLRCARLWGWSSSMLIGGMSLMFTCAVMNAWITLKFGFSCAVSSLLGCIILYSSVTLFRPFFSAATPIGIFHSPFWVRARYGLPLTDEVLQAAKRHRATALEAYS